MGIFDGLFGSSRQVTETQPRVLAGLEPLVPQLVARATTAGSRPYAMRNFARLAPMSGSTRAGIGLMRGAATDPRFGQRVNTAEGMIGSSTDDAGQQALISSLTRNIRPERTGAGTTRAGAWTDPGTAAAYENPHTEQVLDRLLRREDESTAENRAGMDRRLAGKKAFGSGSDIANAQFERDAGNRRADLIAQELNRGYESGANIFRSDADRGLTSATGNVDRAAAAARQNADRALEAQRLRTQGIGMGLTGEGARLAGRRAAGNDMVSLADRYRSGLGENARNLLGIGDIEQRDLQRGMDLQERDFQEQRDFPENRSDFLARTIYGAPTGRTTTQPGPSVASQLLGAGIGIAGLGGSSGFGWWRKGGAVRMAGGGDPLDDLSDNELRGAATNRMLPADMRERAKRLLQGRGKPLASPGIALPAYTPPSGPGAFATMVPPRPPDAVPPTPLEANDPTSWPPRDDFPFAPDESMPPPAPAAMASVPTLRQGADGVYAPGDDDLPLPPPGPAATGGDRLPAPVAGPPGPGVDDTSGGDEAPGSDRYGSILDKLLAAQQPDKGRLLMHIGAAMMAGQRPGFLANVGEGLKAGAQYMDTEEARKLRSLGLAATVEERRQANKDRSADRKARIAEAADKLKEMQRQFNEGKIGEKELRAAQAEYYRARAEGERTGKDRSTFVEREVARQMEEDPTLTRAEARAIVTGSKNKEDLYRARLEEQKADRRRKIIDSMTLGGQKALTPQQIGDLEKEFGPRERWGAGNAEAPRAAPPGAPAAPAPPKGAAPAGAPPAGAPLPMPKTQAELKKGSVYATARGPAIWNGRAFESVQPAP